jgi:hypothetical protein
MMRREVGASLDEYLRGLRDAFPAGEQTGPFEFTARADQTLLRVTMTPLPARRLGDLVMPRLTVNLELQGGSAQQQRALIEHMDRMMLRGGG